jgi:hypothetical protein
MVFIRQEFSRMNVIVICSDTFRYDHLGFVGQQRVAMPNLDQMARESASFSDFWLCLFPTLVNRIEVFTGRYTFPLMDWGALPFHFPVLAEVFKHHGFATALLADNLHMMQEGFGFGRGFDFVKNVPRQASEFPGLPVAIGTTPAVVDLYSLAGCDYILGPPSTFSQWASFYGNKPMLHLSGGDQKIELEKFQVADLHTIP